MKLLIIWKNFTQMRWIKCIVFRFRLRAAVLGKAIELGGGIRSTSELLLRILQAEGMQGVRWRLRHARGLALIPAGQRADNSGPIQPVADAYYEWLRRHDPTDERTLSKLSEHISAHNLRTTFSVIMPVYNPPIEYLKQAIESVQAQVYPHWELCIADDASTDSNVRRLLSRIVELDNRVKVVFRAENGHISAASNSALEMANNEFIALMDHDDLLPRHALAHIALAIHEAPDAALIYSDEDKIDKNNKRYDPYFKCDFNYHLFLAQNMISHLGVYRRDLVKDLGGFRAGVDGAQDWDLALRFIENVKEAQILHVPRVLYHWRAFEGSTALNIGQKLYASPAQIKAVGDHMLRIGKPNSIVTAAPSLPGMLRVRHHLPDPAPLVSIVISNEGNIRLLKFSVKSIIENSNYANYEILVVSDEETYDEVSRYFEEIKKGIQISCVDISNFSASGNCAAAKFARGEYLCLMKGGVKVISPGWISEMISFCAQSDVGCVGAKLWDAKDILWGGGFILGLNGFAGNFLKGLPKGARGYFGRGVLHQELSAVSAACLMIKRQVYEDVGGVDLSFPSELRDIDLCLRVSCAGYRIVWTPYAEHYYHRSMDIGDMGGFAMSVRFEDEVDRIKKKWGSIFESDPAYSPNLTLDESDFSMAWPGRVG